MNINDINKYMSSLEQEAETLSEQNRIAQMMNEYTGDDQVVDTATYLEAMQRLRGGDPYKAFAGLSQLDYLTEGFWEGNIVVISGPTKEGKTTFCQTLTINFAKAKQAVLWMPFDTPGEELIKRFRDPITFYLPKKNASVKDLEWVEQRIIEGIAKYNTRIIFIDHLGSLVHNEMDNSNYATYLQHIMVRLKEIAMQWRVVIFLNHHIAKIGTNETPMLSNLKDSSGVAQEADFVLMIWRKKERRGSVIDYANEARIQVQANRRTGKSGVVCLKHMGDYFIEIENEEET